MTVAQHLSQHCIQTVSWSCHHLKGHLELEFFSQLTHLITGKLQLLEELFAVRWRRFPFVTKRASLQMYPIGVPERG